MNLIHINAHDLGRWLSPYGAAVPAPHLEKLAARSLLFRNAHSVCPTCSPSRGALLTGTYPQQNGLNGLTHRGFTMRHPEWHLAHHLAQHGYRTALSGTQHESQGDAHRIGYRDILTPADADADGKEQRDLRVARAAADYLQSGPDQPFMLSVGFSYPHRKFPAHGSTSARYVSPGSLYPDLPETRADMAGFIAAVAIMDQAVGIVLDALRQSGLERDSVILFTTDHGPAFPGMKCTLHDGGSAVALMLDFPQSRVRGQITDAMVSHLDLYPTLCELLEVPLPAHPLEGQSLMPVLQDPSTPGRTELFTQSDFHAAYQPQRAIRSLRHKLYLRYFEGPDPFPNTDPGTTREALYRFGWQNRNAPRRAFYDLMLDPLEQHNLWDDPAVADERNRMLSRLQEEMERTGDPLRLGPLEPPPGARLDAIPKPANPLKSC